MQQQEFRERIWAKLRETGDTPIRVAVQAGLPRDSIRSVLRGHLPNILRADDICRALGITVTIGARRGMPQSGKEAGHYPRILNQPALSQERTTVEYFAEVVDGRLADLFGSIVEMYSKARTDAERQLLADMLRNTVAAVSNWIASMVEYGTPPVESVISTKEFIDD